jgi:hypothetical protein
LAIHPNKVSLYFRDGEKASFKLIKKGIQIQNLPPDILVLDYNLFFYFDLLKGLAEPFQSTYRKG